MEAGFSGLSRSRGPGAVGLMQDFLNTTDIESETDLVDTPGALADWLASKGLTDGRVNISAAEHARALELRERLRDALEAITHSVSATEALADLDAMAASVALRIRFGQTTRLEAAARGSATAVGPILGTVYDALGDEGFGRLKVCRNDGCRWAFYDTSRNRSGVWCSMAICGNRQKGRVYRSRHAVDR